jgi:predicted ATPase/DNA-binding SARP family transcriptional activator
VDFRILGPLVVNDVPVGGARQRGVLALLLLHANESVSAERLVLGLWGEEAPQSGVKSLQVAVSRLRRELGDADVLETTASGYRLRVAAGELDLDRFERAVEAGRESLAAGRPERAARQLREALGMWSGPPLADVAALPFAAPEIARLEEQRLGALEARIDADLAARRHADLVGELRGLVAEHPWRERLHGQLMIALYRTGRQAEALDAYAAARTALVEQLGIEPGPELRELQAAVLAHDPALAPPSAATRRPALPDPVTEMFGRDTDLDRLCDQIRASRLVTLVGPGGVGKTTLALAVARRLEGELADGARFVPLAPVADPDELERAIERALAVPAEEDGGGLRPYLAPRELLLVLDNFEQLVTGAPVVADLLGAAPRLTVLLTSREPTRLAAERLYPVAPLDGDAAVALFVDRVRARDPAFALNGGAGHVREICERLDHLPLALELAAARIGLLSPAELAARLDRALPLLAGGARDAPVRQRTLRATIDWSYGLLDEAEREACSRFAVFAAGATVEAAEQVTGASLDTLSGLVAKQLLRRRGDRLTMLALVREYALELLAASPDAGAVRSRLAAWLIALAESEPTVADSLESRARLDAEAANLNEAARTALAAGAVDTVADLVIAWWPYWYDCNRCADGLPWAEAVLERPLDPERRARLLLARGTMLGVRHFERFAADLEAALEYFRSSGDAAGIARCLSHLAFGRAWAEDYGAASPIAEEAVAFAQESGDDHVLAQALINRALVQEGFDSIAPAARLAVEAVRRIGQLDQLARLCSIAGFTGIAEGREREALPLLEEGVRAARASSGDRLKFVLGNLGLARLFLGDVEGAGAALVETMAVSVWSVDDPLVDEPLLALAVVYARRGDDEGAATLAGVANAHPSLNRHRDEAIVWDRLDAMLSGARERLGAEAWQRAAARGAVMTPREVLEFLQRPAGGPAPPRRAP